MQRDAAVEGRLIMGVVRERRVQTTGLSDGGYSPYFLLRVY
jgi:hypothetical protein